MDEEGPLFPEIDDGVVKVERLARWSSTSPTTATTSSPSAAATTASAEPPGAPGALGSHDIKFPFAPELNRKIIVWSGDITKINTDAIVNSTNEALNESNGVSEKILSLGGDELIREIISLEGCRTGESKITSAYSLPCRYIIHSVGPRYNLKYRTAAETALYSCYRMSMELLKEYELASVTFTVINTTRRGYPPKEGAHLALRTIRRFLERYGNGIESIVFCLNDEDDRKAYEAALPLYFPRSQAEAEATISFLPADLGNEFGEPVQEERKIRIRDIPGWGSRMNIPVVSEDNPLRNWADPSFSPEGEVVPSFAKMRGDHDRARKEELYSKAGSKARAQENYMNLLRRARSHNLSEIASRNVIYQSGTDSLGRAVVCVNGKFFNPSELDRTRAIMYFIQYMDAISAKDFVIVYYNAGATSENHPDLSLIREFHGSLHPRYSRNLKLFYFVHPSMWVKISVAVLNTFFVSDIRSKIRNIETLSELFQAIPPQQLKVPDYVLTFDKMLTGVQVTETESTKKMHEEL